MSQNIFTFLSLWFKKISYFVYTDSKKDFHKMLLLLCLHYNKNNNIFEYIKLYKACCVFLMHFSPFRVK